MNKYLSSCHYRKWLLYTLVVLPFGINAQAQNLVPNPSFEEYIECPNEDPQALITTKYWYTYFPNPDYFHPCNSGDRSTPKSGMGWQNAHHGVAYVGLSTGNKAGGQEYVANKLNAPLEPCNFYRTGISVNLVDSHKAGTDNLGVLFFLSPPPYFGSGIHRNIPQVSYSKYGAITDKINWTRLTKTFRADSAYDKLIIGGFGNLDSMQIVITPTGKNSLVWGYYFLDSVVVEKLFGFDMNRVLCAGNPFDITFGVFVSDYFRNGNAFTFQLSDQNGSFASPTNIGVSESTASGIIKCNAPNIPTGNNYRGRIVSSIPPDTFNLCGNIQITSGLNLNINSNAPVCPKEDLILMASAVNGAAYRWTGPNSFSSESPNPVISKADSIHSGNYIATASLNDCKATDSITVDVVCNPVAVPTGFSPNGDGNNDVLFVRAMESVKELNLRIYNRWGQLLFETRDINSGWDGTYKGQKFDAEVVAYVLTAVSQSGRTYLSKGNITLIR
ncbi:MAG: hypothetical protein K0R82_2027 [Flavipsychrobacter sp.]|jgi:gliding motility-associated-like protein|nr:hypothetical protein [Flavipsychrobacter sp.]